jgi:hypothetical protein
MEIHIDTGPRPSRHYRGEGVVLRLGPDGGLEYWQVRRLSLLQRLFSPRSARVFPIADPTTPADPAPGGDQGGPCG